MKIILALCLVCTFIIGTYCDDEHYELRHKKHDLRTRHVHNQRQSSTGNPNITITLYTRSQPNGTVLTKANNFANAAYANSKLTKFTTNGWTHPENNYTFAAITKAYLNKSDINVINVNWATLAGDVNSTSGLDNFNTVGNYYTDLLTALIGNGASASRFELIGHGLGAHVSGYAAQRLFATKTVKVARLTGLDPTIKTVRNLTSTDATFVDVIHTSDTLGTYKVLGTCDFYPNNGLSAQPGCGSYDAERMYCSHYASVNYFADTISNATKFLATRCANYELYKAGGCRNNATAYMGESVNRTATGSYFLSIYLRQQIYQPYP